MTNENLSDASPRHGGNVIPFRPSGLTETTGTPPLSELRVQLLLQEKRLRKTLRRLATIRLEIEDKLDEAGKLHKLIKPGRQN